MEWQKIETAPKDQTAVLLYVGDDRWDTGGMTVGFWSGDGWFDDEAASGPIWGIPSYWMPLPAPPSPGQSTEGEG